MSNYFNFTDLLHQINVKAEEQREKYEAIEHPTSEELAKLYEAVGCINLSLGVEKQLTGVHVNPTNIYKAIATQLTSELVSVAINSGGYGRGLKQAANEMLKKANQMSRHSTHNASD